MSKSHAILLGLGFAALSLASAHAAGAKFNIKPGLWEITSTGSTTGVPPIPADVLAQMSPAQRTRIEAAMKAAIAHSSAPHVFKSCVTEKQLEKGPDFANRSERSCKQTVLKRTASAIEVHVECTGKEKMSGVFRYRATSREAFRGTTDFAVSNGDRTMTSKRSVEGKWLGADCGSVKPQGSR